MKLFIYDQNGGSRQITNWVPITAWGRVAEEAANFHKGDMVSAWGKFTSSSYKDQTTDTKRTFYAISADGVKLVFKKHEDNAPKGDFNQFGNEVPPAEIPPADMPY